MHSLSDKHKNNEGPFVYRLGRKIFILERGVRFSYGLLINRKEKRIIMANHKSALKRIRQTQSRRLRNRYYAKTARNAVRRLRALENKEEIAAAYNKVSAMLERLARKNVISKNKAANLKSKLAKHVNAVLAA